jgi:hypothetical protein
MLAPGTTAPSCCDLNGDGVVNAADVQIVLNAALSGSCSAIQSAREVFTSVPYKLAHQPAAAGPAPMVYLNGLLQVPAADYSITDGLLTFSAKDLGDSPVVQVAYWY